MVEQLSGLGRRGFLVSALAGGAVGMGWGMLPATGRSGSARAAASISRTCLPA